MTKLKFRDHSNGSPHVPGVYLFNYRARLAPRRIGRPCMSAVQRRRRQPVSSRQSNFRPTRLSWLGMDAAAAGCGIWATHFIAMLAYDPGVGVGYDLGLTALSLIFAVAITGVGLSIALRDFYRWSAPAGGAIIGGGIAAMHYTGMSALEVPGHFSWSAYLVLVSLFLGILLGGLALPSPPGATIHGMPSAPRSP